MSKINKVISAVIILSMVFSLLPTSIFAETKNANTINIQEGHQQSIQNDLLTYDSISPESAKAEIVGEIVGKRERNVKHFLKDDMTYEAITYPYPVHYKDGDKWKEIDNSLIETKDKDINSVLENKSGDLKINFAKNSNATNLVKIQKGNYQISWDINSNIQNSEVKKHISVTDSVYKSNSTLVTKNSVVVNFRNGIDDNVINKLSKNEQKRVAKNLFSDVTYENIFSNVDLQYINGPEQLKENIILKDRIDNPVFTFEFIVKNLKLSLTNDNCIIFSDDKNNEEVFRMFAPFMYDKNNLTSNNIKLVLEKTAQGYHMTLTPSKDWLNSQDIVYPVTIDPMVSTETADIYDSYVDVNNPNTNYGSSQYLYAKKSSTQDSRIYVLFNLPQISSTDYVTKSSLKLYYNTSSNNSSNYLSAHEVLSTWNESSLTWNNKPTVSDISEDYVNVTSDGYRVLDLTRLTQKWYNVGDNYGIMLKANNIAADESAIIYSGEYINWFNQPTLIVYYSSANGLEDYWTYHTQTLGRAGNGYVNDFNGNVTFVHDDLQMNGNRMPVSISHVFNSIEDDYVDYCGQGWRLNLSQTIEEQEIDGADYYVYKDGDGTNHYFKYTSNKYIDESGLDLELEFIDYNTKWRIKDKKGNSLEFVPNGDIAYLKSIKDNNNNSLTINYTSDYKISNVVDGAYRSYTFVYENSYLKKIKDSLNRELVTYNYVNGRLDNIVYIDTKSSSYTYNTRGKLQSITNNDGYKITYQYYDTAPYRVWKVTESNIDGTIGNNLTLKYGQNTTQFTDCDGNKYNYFFNNYGNTISVNDPEGNAAYYKYYNSGINTNKIKLQSRLQGTVVNKLTDPNFEHSGGWHTYHTYQSNGSSSSSITSDEKMLGSKSMKIENTCENIEGRFETTVDVVKAGKYTLSTYVKTNNISSSSKGAYIDCYYKNNSGENCHYKSKYITGTNDWEKIEVSFDIPYGNLDKNVTVCGMLPDSTGTVYFDGFQLEEGVSNRYNIIENSDFHDGVLNWYESGDLTSLDGIIETTTDTEHPTILDSKCVAIVGEANKTKSLTQYMEYMSGGTGEKYVLGGWARANSMPKGLYQIEIVFRKAGVTSWDSAENQTLIVPFSKDPDIWNYVCDSIETVNPYNGIAVTIKYGNNLNKAWFDGLQLYREEFGTNYTYSSDGNLSTISSTDRQKKQVQYNANNDVEKIVDTNTNHYDVFSTYENHNLKTTTSEENIKNTITYDSYGNPDSFTVGDDLKYIKSSAAYTTNGNYLKTSTDPLGNTVIYNFNESKGTLDSFTDAKDKTTSYTYDNLDRLTDVYKNVSGIGEVRNKYSYENDKLKTIKHNDFNYNFDYDSFGNVKKVSLKLPTSTPNASATPIPSATPIALVNYGYTTDSKLDWISYANGKSLGFDYDNANRLTSVTTQIDTDHGPEIASMYSYLYDANGNVGSVADLFNNANYYYKYDEANRLVKSETSDKNSTEYHYNTEGNIDSVVDKITRKNNHGSEEETFDTNYLYDDDNRLDTVTLHNEKTVDYEYDSLGRLESKAINLENTQYNTNYMYKTGNNGASSSTYQLSSIQNGASSINYTYDQNGNIDTITQGGKTNRYYYDELNSLIREDNQAISSTIVYEYDKGGNILREKVYSYTTDLSLASYTPYSIKNYGYGDSLWKDKLTSYGGKNIVYDEMGNVLDDGFYNYTWDCNGNLTYVKNINTNEGTSYKYNDQGIITEKHWRNGKNHTYYYSQGDKIICEESFYDDYYSDTFNGKLCVIDNYVKLYYSYDSYGNLLGMNYQSISYDSDTGAILMQTQPEDYYYAKNGQGDIIGLIDENGIQVVTYEYDTWGNQYNSYGPKLYNVGIYNPYRYRGYRYDSNAGTGLYYLNSRYYNAKWHRFISADKILGQKGLLTSFNLFAYCGNNPISNADPSGMWFVVDDLVTGPVDEIIVIGGLAILGLCGIEWADDAKDAVWEGITDTCSGIAATCNGISSRISKTKSKTLPDTKKKQPVPTDKVYYLAYANMDTGAIIKKGAPLNYVEACYELSLTATANSAVSILNIEHKGYWGVYTHDQAHAKALALAFGGTGGPEVHGSGFYGHYHDSGHKFHVWYGGQISY